MRSEVLTEGCFADSDGIETCPACNTEVEDGGYNIRTCANCGSEGCIFCQFRYDDKDLCDYCVDNLEPDDDIVIPDYEYGE